MVNEANPRVIAQNGLFMIPRRLSNITKDIRNASDTIYKIDLTMRDEILSVLENLNITIPRLFPDLQNVCNYLKAIEPKV